MSDRPKFHLREQSAYALLAPICLTVRDLEERVRHYLERMILSPEDAAALESAQGTLREVREKLEAVWQTRRPPTP